MDVTSYMLGKKAGGGTITETDPIFSNSAASGITSTDIGNWNDKQDELVSGTNIKTINNESILGSGNIDIQGGGSSYTAGTNIEITSGNVINNKIPYDGTTTGGKIFGVKRANTVISGHGVGTYVEVSGNQSVALGGAARATADNSIAIGSSAKSTQSYSVAIGGTAEVSGSNSICIGYGAATAMANICQLGSSGHYVNNAYIYTSSGNKELATQDYVTSAIATAITSALGGNY